jgi:hypothetical protein
METKHKVIIGAIAILLVFFWNNARLKKSMEAKDQKETMEVISEEISAEVISEINEYDSKEVNKVLGHYESLYRELLGFKDKPEFLKYGLGAGGPYNNWLRKVNELGNDKYSKILLKKSIATGDLINLATEYINTGGKENEFTRTMNGIITEAIKPEKIDEEIDQEIIEDTITDEKSGFQTWGKWLVENTISSRLNQEIEIFFNGTEYYSIVTFSDKSFRRENLRKEGNRFIIVGNKSGEYYRIDPNSKNMTLYDRQGVLDMFKARKVSNN